MSLSRNHWGPSKRVRQNYSGLKAGKNAAGNVTSLGFDLSWGWAFHTSASSITANFPYWWVQISSSICNINRFGSLCFRQLVLIWGPLGRGASVGNLSGSWSQESQGEKQRKRQGGEEDKQGCPDERVSPVDRRGSVQPGSRREHVLLHITDSEGGLIVF